MTTASLHYTPMQEFPQKDRPFSPAAKDSIISAVALCLRPKALNTFFGEIKQNMHRSTFEFYRSFYLSFHLFFKIK